MHVTFAAKRDWQFLTPQRAYVYYMHVCILLDLLHEFRTKPRHPQRPLQAQTNGTVAAQLATEIRGPQDHKHVRIQHPRSKAQETEIPEKMTRRILRFMWSFGPLEMELPCDPRQDLLVSKGFCGRCCDKPLNSAFPMSLFQGAWALVLMGPLIAALRSL